MKRYAWPLFLSVSLILTALFGYGFASAYNDVVNPPKRAVLTPTKEEPVAKGGTYVALGDSLTRGVGASNGNSYAAIVGQELTKDNTVERFQNLAVSGARTEDLLKQLEQKEVLRSLSQAKVISVTIGGNDLFNRGEGVANFDAKKTADTIKSAQTNLEKTFKILRDENPDAVIFYVGLYNPFRASENGEAFDAIVQNWNAESRQLGLEYDIEVIDTFNLVRDVKRDLSSDQFHPNDSTYEQIAKASLLAVNKRF
ncbi:MULTISPECIES: SGNH/GDSL hydrolase family protein [Exiguobacterium]|uniref:Lipase n=1 Tax=Exiguobacterium oxidotolerans TaxID=223958 RepID=A0A653IEY3_9BACL|nr:MULTISPECIES: SGNH/GDSL hydrolase family protein [Exiguobacterium]ASI35024.1 lipase [Exiguobacterium sp. N4-1P]VWX37826.1 Lipase [Exiguobacterium oxidotolerans]